MSNVAQKIKFQKTSKNLVKKDDRRESKLIPNYVYSYFFVTLWFSKTSSNTNCFLLNICQNI